MRSVANQHANGRNGRASSASAGISHHHHHHHPLGLPLERCTPLQHHEHQLSLPLAYPHTTRRGEHCEHHQKQKVLFSAPLGCGIIDISRAAFAWYVQSASIALGSTLLWHNKTASIMSISSACLCHEAAKWQASSASARLAFPTVHPSREHHQHQLGMPLPRALRW